MVKFYKPKKAIIRLPPKYHTNCYYIFIVPPIKKLTSNVLFLDDILVYFFTCKSLKK